MVAETYIRPSWIEPAFLDSLGYVLLKDEKGYLKYESTHRAMCRKGTKYEERIGKGKRFVFFNTADTNGNGFFSCSIREDGDSRTAFQGFIDENDKDFFIKLLDRVL